MLGISSRPCGVPRFSPSSFYFFIIFALTFLSLFLLKGKENKVNVIYFSFFFPFFYLVHYVPFLSFFFFILLSFVLPPFSLIFFFLFFLLFSLFLFPPFTLREGCRQFLRRRGATPQLEMAMSKLIVTFLYQLHHVLSQRFLPPARFPGVGLAVSASRWASRASVASIRV